MSVRNVLLRVTGDGDDAKRALREIAGELVKVGKQKAVAEVRVNAAKAKADLASIKGDLEGLSASAKLDLQVGGAQAKLDELQARLARLSTLESSPKVDIRMGAVVAQIERVEARLATLNARKASPEVSVEGREALARISEVETALRLVANRDITARVRVKVDSGLAQLAVLRREVEHSVSGGVGSRPLGVLFRDVNALGTSLAKVGAEGAGLGARIASGLAGAGTAVGGLVANLGGSVASAAVRQLTALGGAIAIIVPLVAVLAPVVVSLVGALFSLVAVLASAAAGAGALGLALVAAFGPVAAVVGFVAFQIAKVAEAQKKQAAATATAKNALVSQQQAQANLARSQENQANQRLAALAAERDAINGVAQAQNTLDNARLGIEGSKLQLERARQDLADFRQEQGRAGNNSLLAKFKDVSADKLPGALDGAIAKGGEQAKTLLDYREKLYAIKTAAQGVKNSLQAVQDAQLGQSKAQAQAAEFTQKGLRAYDAYDSALRETASAQRASAKATTTLVEAERKRDEVLGQLSPTQSKFAKSLKEIQKVLVEALGPAANEVFAGINDALQETEVLLQDSGVKGSLQEVGRALGDVIRVFGRGISSRGFREAFSELAEGGAELTRVFGTRLLPDLFRLLLAIARIALPSLRRGADGLADSFHGFVEGQLQAGRLEHNVRKALDALRSVGRLGKAALRALGASFGEASDSGKTLVDRATSLLNRLTRILNKAADNGSLRKFFEDSVDTVRDLYHLIRDTVKVITTIGNVVEKVAKAAKFVKDLADPSSKDNLVHRAARGVKGGIKAVGDVLGLPLGAEGGIATGPTIAGEVPGVHEALIPLRPDVLGRLGRSIAAFTPVPSAGLATQARNGTQGGSSVTNHFHVEAPEGHWPDMDHALAVIDQRLKAVGA